MRGWAILVFVLALLTPNAATAQLFGSFPPVIFTINPPNPRAGDTLTVDVYTFAAGQPMDANTTPEAIFTRAGASAPLESFRRLELGHYQGLVRLPTRSLVGQAGSEQGYVRVTGNLTGVPFFRTAIVSWFDAGLYIRLSINKTMPAMGEPLTIRSEVYNRSTPMDPDNITLLVDIPSNPPFHLELLPGRAALGVYEAMFTVPTFSPAYVVVIINAVVYSRGSEIRASLDTHVALYQLWFHGTSVNSTETRGDLWVADAEGRPAANVAVHFLWGYAGTCCISVDGLTDAAGRLPIALTYSTTSQLSINGNVGMGTRMEDFFVLTLWTSDPSTGGAMPMDPPLMPDGSARDFLHPGAQVTRTYRLLNRTIGGGEPYANAAADFYAWTDQRVVASRRSVTDGVGRLAVSFVAPEEDVSVAFMVGPYPVGSVDYRVGSPLVGLNVSALTLGGTTLVRAYGADELREPVDAQFFAYSKSLIALLNPAPGERWERWTRGLGDDLYPVLGGRGHSYALPRFLPASGRYLVAVSVSTGSQSLSQFAVVGVGEAAEVPIGAVFPRGGGGTPTTDLLLPTVALTGAIVAAVVFTIAILRRSRRQPPTAPPTP